MTELARGAACALREAAGREEEWRVRLEQLTKKLPVQSAVESATRSQQVRRIQFRSIRCSMAGSFLVGFPCKRKHPALARDYFCVMVPVVAAYGAPWIARGKLSPRLFPHRRTRQPRVI